MLSEAVAEMMLGVPAHKRINSYLMIKESKGL